MMKDKRNIACILVMVLCNQSEACTSDLGDGQSRYLLTRLPFNHSWATHECVYLVMVVYPVFAPVTLTLT